MSGAAPVGTGRASLPDLKVVPVLAPLAVGALFLGAWQWAVTGLEVDPYVLPAPSAILARSARTSSIATANSRYIQNSTEMDQDG